MSVVFINLFEVPVGRDETFRGLWQQVNDYMRTRPGYQAHRLHRTVADDARWRAAHDEWFRKLVGQPEWREFPNTPALYEVVRTGDQAAPAFA
jgi:heme-degrading monooxygenase HmoA